MIVLDPPPRYLSGYSPRRVKAWQSVALDDSIEPARGVAQIGVEDRETVCGQDVCQECYPCSGIGSGNVRGELDEICFPGHDSITGELEPLVRAGRSG